MADLPRHLYSSETSKGARLLLSLLWSYATHGERDPWVYPKIATLSDELDQDESTTRRQFQELVRAGLVSERKRQTKRNRWVRGWLLHVHPRTETRALTHETAPESVQACAENQALAHEVGDTETVHSCAPDRAPTHAEPRIPARETVHSCTMNPQESPGSPIEGEGHTPERPNASEPERAPGHVKPDFAGILAGRWDGVRTIELLLPGGGVDVVYGDHAAGMGQPNSELSHTARAETGVVLDSNGQRLSQLAKASLVKRIDPFWRRRDSAAPADRIWNATRAQRSWLQMLKEVPALAAAYDEGVLEGPASAPTGPPRREDFDSDEAFQAAVEAFLDAPIPTPTRRRA